MQSKMQRSYAKLILPNTYLHLGYIIAIPGIQAVINTTFGLVEREGRKGEEGKRGEKSLFYCLEWKENRRKEKNRVDPI